MSLLVKIYKNLDFGQNFWKYRFWLSLSKNLKFGQICLILVILVENSRFRSKSKEMSIFPPQYLVLVKIVGKCQFGWKFANMPILVKLFQKSRFQNINFGENCRKISNLDKFVEKSRFWSKLSKVLDFGQNFKKFQFWSKFTKISQFSKNLDFGQIVGNSRFSSKLTEMSI